MSGSRSGGPPDDTGDDDRDRSDERAGTPQTPPPEHASTPSDPDVTIEDDGLVRWFLKTNDETVMMTRDILSSVAIVAAVAFLLFGVSGIWPPLVAVESGSMEPNMQRGDLVFVVEEGRFAGDNTIEDTGVVTLERGQEAGYTKFGNPGDVIVFRPNGDPTQTPVIHRAHFWVDEGERWVETKASEEIVGDATCQEVPSCPAPYAGFITKGDHNPGYDQTGGGADTDIVKPDWITGKAQYRIPWLGHIRLTVDRLLGGMIVPPASSSQLADTQPEPAAMTPAGLASGLESNSELAGIAGVAGGSIALAAGRYRS